jgi:hypothetical protein
MWAAAVCSGIRCDRFNGRGSGMAVAGSDQIRDESVAEKEIIIDWSLWKPKETSQAEGKIRVKFQCSPAQKKIVKGCPTCHIAFHR